MYSHAQPPIGPAPAPAGDVNLGQMATNAAQLWATAQGGATQEQMLNMGADIGSKVFDNMNQKLQQNTGFSQLWVSLKYYFAVDNKFVVRKLRAVLLPFSKKHWHRMLVHDETDPTSPGIQPTPRKFARPVDDENAPDLCAAHVALPLLLLHARPLLSDSASLFPIRDTAICP